MERWNLRELETPGGSRSPVVLESEEAAARAVLIGLEPGQELGEHEVKEHAVAMKKHLLSGDIRGMAEVLNQAWTSKKRTASSISNSNVERLLER